MDSRTNESPAGGNGSALLSEAAAAGFEQSMLGSGLPTSLEAVQVVSVCLPDPATQAERSLLT